MKYLFYLAASLLMMLVQTTIIHHWSILGGFYDLFIVIVLFVGLYRNQREGLPVILLLGIVMDNLYNGPFGSYTTVYIWLYATVRLILVYFNVRNRFFMIFAVASGVLFENFVLIGASVILDPNSQLPGDVAKNIIIQILWAILTGSVCLAIISRAYNSWRGWFKPVASEESIHR